VGSDAHVLGGVIVTEETKTAGFDESLFLVNMSLDMDADRIADQDEDEQDPQEKAILLAFREVVRRVETQAKRIEELEEALRFVVRNEMPPGDPDPINPGEFVMMCPSHMDHEGYRESIRRAAALVGMKRQYE